MPSIPLTPTTIHMHQRHRRAVYRKAGILLFVGLALLLVPLTGLLETKYIPILIGLCMLLASLAGFQIVLSNRIRLELRPESITLIGLGFRLVTPWTQVLRLGQAPWNEQHPALILDQAAPLAQGIMANAVRQQALDLDDFVSTAPDDPVLRLVQQYLAQKPSGSLA